MHFIARAFYRKPLNRLPLVLLNIVSGDMSGGWLYNRLKCVILLSAGLFSTDIMSCQQGGRSCGDLSKKLTAQQYRVTQEKGTERAFTGEFYDHHETGTYFCICCEAPLFR